MMNYLFHVDELKGSKEEPLIGVVLNDKVRHCGLSYDVIDKLNAKIIDLGFHNDLNYRNSFDDLNWWIKPSIHPIQMAALVPLCEVIHEKQQSGDLFLAYGLRYDEYATIQMDGKLEYGKNGTGLTCATFILTIFHSCGIDLVDLSDWEPRIDDDGFFAYIKGIFKDAQYRQYYKISPEHADKQITDKDMKRVRPEEVAVSTVLYNGVAAPKDKIRSEAANLKAYIIESSKYQSK